MTTTAKIELGTERARLAKIESGLYTERARLGTFRGVGTEPARLGTFRGFGTELARLGTLNQIFVLGELFTYDHFTKEM